MNTILEIENLCKYYGKQENQTKALDGITFQVMKGEFLGIMGSSGSGKSTLLNCIATVIQPTVERLLCAERKFNHSKAPNWQTTGENRLVICFRILNCLIILQAVKTSSFPCLFIMFPKAKATRGLWKLLRIWKLQMYWTNFRLKCPVGKSRELQLPER